MVARFELVMVGFSGGHLGVGWVSQWRSGLRLGFWGWVTMEIGLWVTAWLESVGVGLRWRSGYESQHGLNQFVVDRHWVGASVVWIDVGFVVVVLWLFATIISNSSKLTKQHRSVGSHRVRIFKAMPLSYVTQKLKTPIWCFRFSSLSLKIFEF